MTTSNGWDSDPATSTTPDPQYVDPQYASPQYPATPIADDLTESPPTPSADDTSTKDRAQHAADSAKHQGSEVASTAADEAKEVAEEAKAKATDLLSDVKAQVDEQSRTQLQGVAAKLGELGDELDGLIRGDGSTDGTVTDLARQLSERTRALSSHLADREPMDLVEDVRSFARRKPGIFLIGAAAAGLVAGRLTRGAKKANDQPDGSTSGAATTSAPPASPFPSGGGTDESGVAPVGDDLSTGQHAGGRL